MAANEDIDSLVKVLSQTLPGGSDMWPLKPLQLFPYVDMDQCLDLLGKIKDLKNRGISDNEVTDLIKRPTLIRSTLANIGCTGLKVAKNLKIGNITVKDQVDLVSWFINLLKIITPNDPVCEKGTNQIHSQKEIDNINNNMKWQKVDDTNRRVISSFSVDLITLTWALYWPYFPSAGYETYGPYPIIKDGIKSNLLIKEYYNLKPNDIWSTVKSSSFKQITLYQIYDTSDIFLTYGNRITSTSSLPQHNTYFSQIIDGVSVNESEKIEIFANKISILSKKQTNYVNKLSDIELVKKGAQLSYYSLKDFYLKFWNSWFPEETVDKTINFLGDKFIKSGKNQKDRTQEEKAKLFDPRNSFI